MFYIYLTHQQHNLNYINQNGTLVPVSGASVPHDNRAFRYGYGLFETMLVRNGSIALKEYHMERLFSGMKQLHFNIPTLMTPQWLEEQVIRTVKKNCLIHLCRVRLQVYAGSGGLYDAHDPKAGFIIECFPLQESTLSLNENGLVVELAAGIRKSNDELANLKSSNALIYATAAQQAHRNKWNDSLITNTNGHIIESTIANIFWIKDKTIYTPPLTDGCVAGVMRRHLMTLFQEKGMLVIERHCTTDELLTADEIFLTNAIKPLRWISDFESRKYTNDQSKHIYQQLIQI